MNPRLKESLEAAETVLPQSGQDRLAVIVEAFTANFQASGQTMFSEAELAELREIESEGFKEADSGKVSALYAKHGL